MNTIVVQVFIGFFLFCIFGLFPAWICCSHNDHINHDRYLILDDI